MLNGSTPLPETIMVSKKEALIILETLKERDRQETLGYDHAHDDLHTPQEWSRLFEKYAVWTEDAAIANDGDMYTEKIVQLISLGFAALEAEYRRQEASE